MQSLLVTVSKDSLNSEIPNHCSKQWLLPVFCGSNTYCCLCRNTLDHRCNPSSFQSFLPSSSIFLLMWDPVLMLFGVFHLQSSLGIGLNALLHTLLKHTTCWDWLNKGNAWALQYFLSSTVRFLKWPKAVHRLGTVGVLVNSLLLTTLEAGAVSVLSAKKVQVERFRSWLQVGHNKVLPS